MTRKGILRLAAFVAMAALAAGPARAGDPSGNGACGTEQGGHSGGLGDLCASGPAGCVAIGLRVDVYPNAALPYGASVELARTQANAFAQGWMGYGAGYGHGDAHTAQASVPATLGAGVIESRCDAAANGWEHFTSNWAAGSAETTRLALSLASYGVPAYLFADVLREIGSSYAGTGTNSANIADVSGGAYLVTLPPVSESVPPNTVVPLGPVGTLYLNEQTVVPPSMFNPCPVFNGDAARLVINDPSTGAPAAQVLVSWVSTSTCP